MTRREALAGFAQFLAASPLLADRKYSELSDPMYSVANVFDMAKLAKKKLDPLAWDYIDEGSEDEISLRDNRTGFERLIIRPHFLQNDVSKIDISTKLFGKELAHPIFICPTGGKNCVFPQWRAGNRLRRGAVEHHDDHQRRHRQSARIRQGSENLVAVHNRRRVPHQEPNGELCREAAGQGLQRHFGYGGYLSRVAPRAQHS